MDRNKTGTEKQRHPGLKTEREMECESRPPPPECCRPLFLSSPDQGKSVARIGARPPSRAGPRAPPAHQQFSTSASLLHQGLCPNPGSSTPDVEVGFPARVLQPGLPGLLRWPKHPCSTGHRLPPGCCVLGIGKHLATMARVCPHG